MITGNGPRRSGPEGAAVSLSDVPVSRGLSDQPPLRYDAALWGLAGCVVSTARLLWRRRVHLPTEQVGRRLRFADGTSARVYRETAAGHGATEDPCVLVVEFRLRAVRGWAHAAFRWESLLNTPLFVGFPGFASKLWLAHDEEGFYRGIYEWDGAASASQYARSLWRVLEIGCEPGSIEYRVVPGMGRDEFIRQSISGALAAEGARREWWLPVA